MCLAIPGRILQLLDEPGLAMIEVAGVRRKVNVELLRDEGLAPDDWVLIHVGFAMSKISQADADEQMRLLTMLGEDRLAQEEMQGYRFG
ncbi:MAG TPA: HypC/HybG/HupF family hydrogenase formation chaperone [Gemmatimonadales bacterium]|nr:HypC/HybG/HupF family hydrogenase formation chaperone [Gemmatimonadales bacterium]